MLLGEQSNIQVVGDVASSSAISSTPVLKPQVILLSLDGGSPDAGMRLLSELRSTASHVPVVTTTARKENAEIIFQAFQGGASGCIFLNSSGVDDIAAAIVSVARGDVFLAAPALQQLVNAIASGPGERAPEPVEDRQTLTPREEEILNLVARGYSNRRIAEELVISESTVRSHIHNLFDKLQLTNRVQAAAFALRSRTPVRAQ
jgi:two-component system response regulator NreC